MDPLTCRITESGHETPAAEAAADAAADAKRRKLALKRASRESLLRYVHSIIEQQTKPLHEIVRDYALPRLPVRSLRRFCAVSRSWNGHIRSPFFAHNQSLAHRSLSGLFFTSSSESPDPPAFYITFDPAAAHSVPDPYLSFLPEGLSHVRAVASGLVVSSSQYLHGHVTSKYIVCNPATEQWAKLPTPAWDHDGVALIFEPSPLNFDAENYLIVCTWAKRGDSGSEVVRRFEVFDSTTGEWSIQRASLKGKLKTLGLGLAAVQGVAAGGKVYWRTEAGAAVISYDPAADRCAVLKVPAEADGASAAWYWQLGEINGRLCCVCCSKERGTVSVFLLREDDSKEKSESRAGVWRNRGVFEVGAGLEMRPLVSGGGDGEALVWVEGAVVGFDAGTGRRRILCGSLPLGEHELLNCVPYVSSFVPVRQFCGASCSSSSAAMDIFGFNDINDKE